MTRLRLLFSACLLLAGPLLLPPGGARADDRARPEAPALPERMPLDVAGFGPLSVRAPDRPLEPVRFRHDGRRGWVVRLPTPRAPAPTPGNERLATVPSPAVQDGRVFAGAGFDAWALHAFHARTGRHEWTAAFEDNGPTTPTLTPRKLVCNTESCTTYAITPSSGKRVWSRWIGPSVMGAPAVSRGVVYTGHRTKSGECLLTAMRLSNGEVLWERALTRDLYGKPIIAGKRIYTASRDGVVACFEITGQPRWFSQPNAGCAPWVTEDGLYIAERDAWRKGAPAVRKLDPETGRTLWRTDVALVSEGRRSHVERYERTSVSVRLHSGYATDGPRPVVLGRSCLLAGGRDLISFDVKDGTVRWIRQLPTGRRFHAPPAVLKDRLVYATLGGLLLEVDARSGEAVQGVDLGALVSSQPVVADGRLHVTAGTLLYGIPWGSRSDPDWPQWGGSARDRATTREGRRRAAARRAADAPGRTRQRTWSGRARSRRSARRPRRTSSTSCVPSSKSVGGGSGGRCAAASRTGAAASRATAPPPRGTCVSASRASRVSWPSPTPWLTPSSREARSRASGSRSS